MHAPLPEVFVDKMARAQVENGRGGLVIAHSLFREAFAIDGVDDLNRGRAIRGAASVSLRQHQYDRAESEIGQAYGLHLIDIEAPEVGYGQLREFGETSRIYARARYRREISRRLGDGVMSQATVDATHHVLDQGMAALGLAEARPEGGGVIDQYRINAASIWSVSHLLIGQRSAARMLARWSWRVAAQSEDPSLPTSNHNLSAFDRMLARTRARGRAASALTAAYFYRGNTTPDLAFIHGAL